MEGEHFRYRCVAHHLPDQAGRQPPQVSSHSRQTPRETKTGPPDRTPVDQPVHLDRGTRPRSHQQSEQGKNSCRTARPAFPFYRPFTR